MPEGLGTLIYAPLYDAHCRAPGPRFRGHGADYRREPGQVASQTMEAITCTDAVVGMPVFRLPHRHGTNLRSLKSPKNGTYETSILPL